MANGILSFNKIEQLPDSWWTASPDVVWTVWDEDTYYLWGANQGNYNLKQGDNLSGGGMAGYNGPTRGYAHDHYVGLDTMDYSDTRNPSVFTKLTNLIKSGKNIVIPTFHGCYSLGTGIASHQIDWVKIQVQIMQGLIDLANLASSVQIPDGTFWPDCRTQVTFNAPNEYDGKLKSVTCSICDREYHSHLNAGTNGAIIIKSVADMKSVVTTLGS